MTARSFSFFNAASAARLLFLMGFFFMMRFLNNYWHSQIAATAR